MNIQTITPTPAQVAEATKTRVHAELNICHDILRKEGFAVAKNTEVNSRGIYYTIALYLEVFDGATAYDYVKRINALVTGYARATYFPNTNMILIK